MSTTNTTITEAQAVERHTKIIGHYLNGKISYHEMAQELLVMTYAFSDANSVEERDSRFLHRLTTITSELLHLAEGVPKDSIIWC